MLRGGCARVSALVGVRNISQTSIRRFASKVTPPQPLTAEETAVYEALRAEMGKRRNWMELLVGSFFSGSVIALFVESRELARPGNWMSFDAFYAREKDRGANVTEPQLTQDIVLKRVPKSTLAPPVAPNPEGVVLTREIIKSHLVEMNYPLADVEAALGEETSLGRAPDVTRTLLAVHRRLDARQQIPIVPHWRYGVRHRHVTFIIPAGAPDTTFSEREAIAGQIPAVFKPQLVELHRTFDHLSHNDDDRSLHVCTLSLETRPEESRLLHNEAVQIRLKALLYGSTASASAAVAYGIANMFAPTTLRAFATRINPGLAILPLGLVFMPTIFILLGLQSMSPWFRTHPLKYYPEHVSMGTLARKQLYHDPIAAPSLPGTYWVAHITRYFPVTTGQVIIMPDGRIVLPGSRSTPPSPPPLVSPAPPTSVTPASPTTSPTTTTDVFTGGTEEKGVTEGKEHEEVETKSVAKKRPKPSSLDSALGLMFVGVAIFVGVLGSGVIVSVPVILPFSYLWGRRLGGRLNRAMREAEARHRATQQTPASTP